MKQFLKGNAKRSAQTFVLLLAVAIVNISIARSDDGGANATAVICEDFATGNAALQNWRSEDLSFWNVDSTGALVGENTSSKSGIAINSPRFDEKDLRLSFRFKIEDAKGVQLKLNHVGGGHIGRFIIQPTGFLFQANKNRELGITEAKNFRRVLASITKDKWHTFEIDLLGDEITATLDGEHSGAYRYDPLAHNIGQFSFAIMGRSARFDNVLVLSRQPSPSDAEQPTTEGKPASEKHARAANDLDADWKRPLQPFFNSYCIDCHGDGADEGGFEFESLGSDLLDAEVRRRWVLAFDRIQKGEMPPPDYDVPEAGDRTEFLTTLSGHLKKAHASEREVVLRRLNRVEYENTINDLFGVDMRLAESTVAARTSRRFIDRVNCIASSLSVARPEKELV